MSSFQDKVKAAAFSKFADTKENQQLHVESAETGHATITMDLFEVDLWVEHDRDVRLQMFPVRKRVRFAQPEKTMVQADRVFGRVLEGKLKAGDTVVANAYGPGFSASPISRNRDVNHYGMQMLDVNFTGLYRRHDAVDLMVDALKLLHEILAGTAHPLES